LVLLMRNGQKPQVPTKDTILQAGDRIIALTPIDNEGVLRKELAGS
jgi:Trk K+ transport system NAD-binding subunit